MANIKGNAFRCVFAATAIAVGVHMQGAWAQGAPVAVHSQRVAQAKAACAAFEGRKLSLVIPFKPGGGFDLMARALEPVLSSHSGMTVSVSNMAGGMGMLAVRAVVNASSDKPVIGLVDLGSFPSQVVREQPGVALSSLVGLGVMAADQTVWVTRQPLAWPTGPHPAFPSASTTGPYVRLGIPGQLLGLNLKPVFGFEGTNQGWLALLRGDIDIVTMSDQSASRNLATGASAVISLTLTDRPHPDFPGAPYLAGPGGLVDARTRKMPSAERQRLMDRAAVAVVLSEQARTLVASAKLSPPLLSCLRHSTEAALFDPALAGMAKRQKFDLTPLTAQAAEEKMQKMDRALREHRDHLRAIAAAWKEGG